MTKQKVVKKLYIVSFILCILWISYNNIPIIPIGLLVGLLINRKIKKVSLILTMILGSMVGFIGTGINLNLSKTPYINNFTGKVEQNYGINISFNLGYQTINNLVNEQKLILNNRQTKTIINHIKLIHKIVQSYNKDSKFITKNFNYTQGLDKESISNSFNNLRIRYGEIQKYKLIGYKEQLLPNNEKLYEFYYKASFNKTEDFTSFKIAIIEKNKKTLITQFIFFYEEIKYKIINN